MDCSAQHFVATVASWLASVLRPEAAPHHGSSSKKRKERAKHGHNDDEAELDGSVFASASYAFHHSPPGAGEVQAAQAAAAESDAQCAGIPYVPVCWCVWV